MYIPEHLFKDYEDGKYIVIDLEAECPSPRCKSKDTSLVLNGGRFLNDPPHYCCNKCDSTWIGEVNEIS